jgi:uncharacterized RDD family membrane protein YckC
VAAFGVDYLVILSWIAVITGAGACIRKRFGIQLRANMTPRDKRIGHLVGFVSLTLPVTLYFAVCEHSRWHGTLGKHVLGIQVERVGGGSVSFYRSLVRAAVKFIPWELAHTLIWHSPGRPFRAAPTTWGIAGYVLSLGLACLYLGSTMVGNGRTPYDRLAGTLVTLSDPPRQARRARGAVRQ